MFASVPLQERGGRDVETHPQPREGYPGGRFPERGRCCHPRRFSRGLGEGPRALLLQPALESGSSGARPRSPAGAVVHSAPATQRARGRSGGPRTGLRGTSNTAFPVFHVNNNDSSNKYKLSAVASHTPFP